MLKGYQVFRKIIEIIVTVIKTKFQFIFGPQPLKNGVDFKGRKQSWSPGRGVFFSSKSSCSGSQLVRWYRWKL